MSPVISETVRGPWISTRKQHCNRYPIQPCHFRWPRVTWKVGTKGPVFSGPPNVWSFRFLNGDRTRHGNPRECRERPVSRGPTTPPPQLMGGPSDRKCFRTLPTYAHTATKFCLMVIRRENFHRISTSIDLRQCGGGLSSQNCYGTICMIIPFVVRRMLKCDLTESFSATLISEAAVICKFQFALSPPGEMS